MKILCTGGNGYVGSVLVPILTAAQHQVVIVDRSGPEYELPFGAQWYHIYLDQEYTNLQEQVLSADGIIHLAAIVGYPACDKDPDTAWGTNLALTDIINDFRREDQPIVFASSDTVYGKIEGQACNETTIPNPQSVYARSKYMAEQSLLRKGNAVILRFATGFGVSPKMRFDTIPNNFSRAGVVDKKIEVYQPRVLRSFVHVLDMARALTLSLENAGAMRDEIYNVGASELNLEKILVADKVAERTGCEVISVEGTVDKEGRDYSVDYSKFRKFSYQEPVSLDAGLDELVKYFTEKLLQIPLDNRL